MNIFHVLALVSRKRPVPRSTSIDLQSDGGSRGSILTQKRAKGPSKENRLVNKILNVCERAGEEGE